MYLGSVSPSALPVSAATRTALARYAPLVDDVEALIVSAARPLPVCLWTNPVKGCSSALVTYLKTLGVHLEPIPWRPGAFKSNDWRSPGHTLAFTAGWYYVQEEIAMTAVQALDPQPGERILDLCAAPGGKTAQIATCLQATGQVVANELHGHRLPSLSTTVARLGLTNVMITQGDGRTPLFPNHTFDRVLVDAPCSGEGTVRRRQTLRPWQPDYGLRIAAAQKKLLSRALDLVKPGGTVVYSTCTFAPEENEAVLNAVMGDRANLEPIPFSGLRGQPGITRWQGQSYRPDIHLACRYFPHINDTGGFFVARLRRTTAPPETCLDPCEIPQLFPISESQDHPLRILNQRFAIAESDLWDYQCWSTGKRRLWLSSKTCTPIPGASPQTIGIPLASPTKLGLKPSTAFLQRFGQQIHHNRVELADSDAAQLFVQGQSQPFSAAVERGYVHVRYGPFHLGCGQYSGGQLHSQLPKTLRWLPKTT